MRLFVFFLCFVAANAQIKYRICAYRDEKCDSLSKGDSKVECIKVQDSPECAMKIQNDEIDFGTFQSEQVLLLSGFIQDEIGVVADIRTAESEFRNNSFKTVLLVPNDHTNGLTGLRNKSYCRSDLNKNSLWTLRVSEELENTMSNIFALKTGACEQNGKSITKNRLENINKIFGDSCRAGKWSDNNMDEVLKQNYLKLCKLCDDKNKCLYNTDNYLQDPNESVLKCLEDKNGYFGFTTLSAANIYFLNNYNAKSKYKLLCRDGTMQDISDTIDSSCGWRNEPWPKILGSISKLREIQRDLNDWLYESVIIHNPEPYKPKSNEEKWKQELKYILAPSNDERFYIYDTAKTLAQHLSENNQDIVFDDDTDCPVRWCTISNIEQQKCLWLSQASKNYGLYPAIKCAQSNSIYHCLHRIQKKEADVMTIDSNHGYLARKNNLRNLLYIEEGTSISTILALVKSDSSIGSFKDLKGKNACFPEYQGIAWLSFIKTARESKLLSDSCDYERLTSKFFNKICAPGAKDQLYHRATSALSSDLCNLCSNSQSDSCEASVLNQYFNNNGSLTCLDESGDVAFVEKEAIDWQNIDRSKYKVLCKSGGVKSLDEINDGCALIETIDSEIVFRGNDDRKLKYTELLYQMDNVFGTDQSRFQLMQMFKLFNGTKDIMFKSKSIGFESSSNPKNRFVQNYIQLFEHVDKCNSATKHITSSLLIIFMSVITLNFSLAFRSLF